MIDLEKQDLDEIKALLRYHVPDCEIRAYGSRVKGTARKYSDLDLVVVGDKSLDLRKIDSLKDAFSGSNLPIMVDIQDWYHISESFRKLIEEKYVVIQKPEGNNA